MPVQVIEPLPTLLESNTNLEPTDEQPQILEERSFQDEFHWSDVFNAYDVNRNGGSNVDGDGNVSSDLASEENIQNEGDGAGMRMGLAVKAFCLILRMIVTKGPKSLMMIMSME
ncbi:hypothetical protein Pint_10232 [Pistacia integerrima]|uniref:Uncharacterized protein n=1 Tax=Pistacia integerrima TaxID=434235 RepID=A0ACC0XJZ3_9ROSI|nr:hypothetical protein Pint_10232 [Pistacia integerrima]